jgi:hypothetical protein
MVARDERLAKKANSIIHGTDGMMVNENKWQKEILGKLG